MEKYFIVTVESRLHKDYFDFQENHKAVDSLVKSFFEGHGIEAKEYFAEDDCIYIVPTDADISNFDSTLCTPLNNGLRKFKASSKVHKAWIKTLQEQGMKVLRRPMTILYFKTSGGRFRSRLFDQDGKLYCSLDPVNGDIPKGMLEIKASEFFKVVESEEESA